jgi:hypothetical protein
MHGSSPLNPNHILEVADGSDDKTPSIPDPTLKYSQSTCNPKRSCPMDLDDDILNDFVPRKKPNITAKKRLVAAADKTDDDDELTVEEELGESSSLIASMTITPQGPSSPHDAKLGFAYLWLL